VTYGEVSKGIIDRTIAFDSTIHQMMNGKWLIPWNADELGEIMPRKPYNGFYHQMIQQTRVEEEDTKGRIVARWRKNKNADHWHHADMFAWCASLRTATLVIPPHISRAFQEGGSLVAT
jgi:hypothetical protein